MKKEKTTVNCPTCQTQVEWDIKNSYRPFCSKRCQLIDLGEWANETLRIPTDEIDEQTLWGEESSPQFDHKDD